MKHPLHFLSLTALALFVFIGSACSPTPPTPDKTTAPAESMPGSDTQTETPASTPAAPAYSFVPPPMPAPSPLAPIEPSGTLVFQSDFETAPSGAETSINWLAHPGYRSELIELSGAGQSDTAAILSGGDAPKHKWKPALEFRFAPQSEGRLKISFDLYQASYDTGSLDIQVVDLRKGFTSHQSLTITNEFIRGPGSSTRLFKDAVTAGSEARWHRVEWILPLPGQNDSEMSVQLDGTAENKMRHSHKKEGAITAIRFFLQLNRNADIVYIIDNLLIEKLP